MAIRNRRDIFRQGRGMHEEQGNDSAADTGKGANRRAAKLQIMLPAKKKINNHFLSPIGEEGKNLKK